VTATDLDRDRLPVVDGMTVLRHDISRDPVPSGEWDLIHARLVLQHLPDRRHVVAKLSGALRPGGWLLLEDFDCRHLPAAVAPSEADATLFARVTRAILVVLERAGADLGWGVHAYGAMRAAGLVDVAAQLRSQIWAGGTPGCLLHLTNSRQLARPLQEAGLDAGTLDRFRALMRDPAFAASFYLMVSTRGRRDREGR
jgi:SAM-dependent methyltransferase